MTRLVQFNSENWEPILTFSSVAAQLGEFTYVPIPPADAPIFLESSIVATFVTTVIPPGRFWSLGGWMEQRFISGLTVGGSTDAAGISQRMLLDRITTIVFPKISASYSLRFYFPKYFKSVNLQAWQYTGPDDDSLRVTLAEEFANLNFKIDQLL